MAASMDHAMAVNGWAYKSEEVIKPQIIRKEIGMVIT
jgi:hypothetical protein